MNIQLQFTTSEMFLNYHSVKPCSQFSNQRGKHTHACSPAHYACRMNTVTPKKFFSEIFLQGGTGKRQKGKRNFSISALSADFSTKLGRPVADIPDTVTRATTSPFWTPPALSAAKSCCLVSVRTFWLWSPRKSEQVCTSLPFLPGDTGVCWDV